MDPLRANADSRAESTAEGGRGLADILGASSAPLARPESANIKTAVRTSRRVADFMFVYLYERVLSGKLSEHLRIM
ncbi:hypothetical protein [Sorangium cellulosum]|uniref:Uncharacterized protein n=1 Tax=Sorangium cellulosum So0157-2 TaxID=1254432 RepID=S4Y3G0_SORCE|nr:hypothetical protein [Sorangium cellulosum]AGP38976.1 hypothetical protein SCE1572_33505 [Sorangium cellulosum So0157-2]